MYPITPDSAAGIAVAKVQSFAPDGVTAANSTPFITKILTDLGANPTDNWCAAFASWAFQAAVHAGASGTAFPYDAGTQDILAWFNHWQSDRVTTDPQDVLGMTGAIYIATDPDLIHGHMGFIVNRGQDSSGKLVSLLTCEGNTTDPDGSGTFGAFLKMRQVERMGDPYGWVAVHYINTTGIAGGTWF